MVACSAAVAPEILHVQLPVLRRPHRVLLRVDAAHAEIKLRRGVGGARVRGGGLDLPVKLAVTRVGGEELQPGVPEHAVLFPDEAAHGDRLEVIRKRQRRPVRRRALVPARGARARAALRQRLARDVRVLLPRVRARGRRHEELGARFVPRDDGGVVARRRHRLAVHGDAVVALGRGVLGVRHQPAGGVQKPNLRAVVRQECLAVRAVGAAGAVRRGRGGDANHVTRGRRERDARLVRRPLPREVVGVREVVKWRVRVVAEGVQQHALRRRARAVRGRGDALGVEQHAAVAQRDARDGHRRRRRRFGRGAVDVPVRLVPGARGHLERPGFDFAVPLPAQGRRHARVLLEPHAKRVRPGTPEPVIVDGGAVRVPENAQRLGALAVFVPKRLAPPKKVRAPVVFVVWVVLPEHADGRSRTPRVVRSGNLRAHLFQNQVVPADGGKARGEGSPARGSAGVPADEHRVRPGGI